MEIDELHIPPPYDVRNGCLGYLKGEKNREPEFVPICNFVPYIASQLIVDDGMQSSALLEIGGFDANGDPLPVTTVQGERFAAMEWPCERWGYEYYLDAGKMKKDLLRVFLQQTAMCAEKKTVYAVTGWKKIEGQWRFLMPGDEKTTVCLEGRNANYGFLRETDTDKIYPVVTIMYAVAPKEVMFPLTAFAFLSPLNSFLRKAQHEPKTVLMLCGKTGSRKSSLAALFCSFFGRFSVTELPLSFRDTPNSIIRQSFALKDILTVIDDYHPSTGRDASQMNAGAQMIFRAYGNRVGRGRLNARSEPMTDRYPQGNAIITAEFPPDVGESGTARCITLELGRDDVNNDHLSFYQQYAQDGILSACMYQYTEWIAETYLFGEHAEDEFVKKLSELCKETRKELAEKGRVGNNSFRDRLLDDMVSLHVGYAFYLDFLEYKKILASDAKGMMLDEFDEVILSVAAKQQSRTEQETPTHIFIRKLRSLIDTKTVLIAEKSMSDSYPSAEGLRVVGYEDETNYYLDKTLAHRAVKKLCDDQGECFAISEKALAKALTGEGIAECDAQGNPTRIVKIAGKSCRLLVIPKDRIEAIIADEN